MTLVTLRAAMVLGAAVLFCAMAPKTPPTHTRSIGIITALGDTCMFERVRDTDIDWIAPPEAQFLEVSDWGIDEEVTNSITKLLGGRYRVQPIAIEHQDFDNWTYATLARHIREMPIPEIPVDAYLLVLRDWRHDAIGNTNHQVGGLGLYRRDRQGHPSVVGVFASYRLVLLDASSGDLIASRPALLAGSWLPWLPAKPSLWPRTTNDLTDAQRALLLEDFKNLIDSTLPQTLQSVALIPNDSHTPCPGDPLSCRMPGMHHAH